MRALLGSIKLKTKRTMVEAVARSSSGSGSGAVEGKKKIAFSRGDLAMLAKEYEKAERVHFEGRMRTKTSRGI